MSRSLWTGYISFGMVNIPVALVAAVRDKNIRFHLLHKKDAARLHQKLVCPVDGEEVPREDAARGFQIGPDQYVEVEQSELEALEPKRTRMIEISDFVEMSQIDPIYYDHPYYLIPDESGAKAYALLRQAMVQMQKTAIGKFVFHNREYIVAIRPLDHVFCLEVMHFADEIVDTADLDTVEHDEGKADEKQLEMAKQLIEALARDFKPQDYRDEYRDKVMELIEKKAKGEEVVTAPPEFQEATVIDLMAALEKSLKQVRSGRKEAPPEARKARGSGAKKGAGSRKASSTESRKRKTG